MKLYEKIYQTLQALNNCKKENKEKWINKHIEKLDTYNNLLPSGSGINNGSYIDIDNIKNETITISSSYDTMKNDMYDKTIVFKIIVKPSLFDNIDIKITPITELKKAYVDDYIHELFYNALKQEIKD